MISTTTTKKKESSKWFPFFFHPPPSFLLSRYHTLGMQNPIIKLVLFSLSGQPDIDSCSVFYKQCIVSRTLLFLHRGHCIHSVMVVF